MPPRPVGPHGFVDDLKARGCRVVRAVNPHDEPPFLTCIMQGPVPYRSVHVMCYFDPDTHRFVFAYRIDRDGDDMPQIKTMVGVRRMLGVDTS
jgi:hypothetical protein